MGNARIELLPLWLCNSLAVVFCLTRLALRLWRHSSLNKGDYWTLATLVFVIPRTVGTHYILVWGSVAAVTRAKSVALDFTPEQVRHIIIASKISLLVRSSIIACLWCLKMVVLDLLHQILKRTWHPSFILYSFYFTIAATYLAAQIAILLECRPLKLYWQLQPHPGQCVQGRLWLFTYEIGNIITDAMLMALPFPILFQIQTTLRRRIQLCVLFGLTIFLICVSIVRLTRYEIGSDHVTYLRITWSSIETLFAAFVAQTPTIYGLTSRPRSRRAGYRTGAADGLGYSRGSKPSSHSKNPSDTIHIDDLDGFNDARKSTAETIGNLA